MPNLHFKEENIIKNICKFKWKGQRSADPSGNSNQKFSLTLPEGGVTLLPLMEVICTLWAEDWLKAPKPKSTLTESTVKPFKASPYSFQTILS